MRMKRSSVAITAALGLVVAGGSAFTAANTVPVTSAGSGSSTTSGFAVSAVTYTLDTVAQEGDEVKSVRFRLDPIAPSIQVATTARVRFTGGSTKFEGCVIDSAATSVTAPQTAWVCAVTTTVKVSSMTNLEVVAVA
jgi:hypothetical protein